jgi:hypothetical protein
MNWPWKEKGFWVWLIERLTTWTPTPPTKPDEKPPVVEGQYVHIFEDNPVNVVANNGSEISGVGFGGCDIRFLANDSSGHGYFINQPKGFYSLSINESGDIVASGKDFEADGARFRYAGCKAATSSSKLRTDNPVVIPKAEWKFGDKTTGRFFWQTVK